MQYQEGINTQEAILSDLQIPLGSEKIHTLPII